MKRLLVANRGEIAIRIMHAAAELGLTSIAIYSEDDAQALHPRKADLSVALGARGAAAYLDADHIVALAREHDCDAVHPGYGFLSENAAFAEAVEAAGMTFVGPTPQTLRQFGDKTAARALAERVEVPVVPGTDTIEQLAEGLAFFDSLGPRASVLVKALAGGGGRGMRVVSEREALEGAIDRCRSEAAKAFGDGSVYLERFWPNVRHIEVQIIGDGQGTVRHLWERECSIQRRHQKIVEIAPSPTLEPARREALIEAALAMARAATYRSLGTFEFLLDRNAAPDEAGFAFIEANPRLQVEHTVTEQVTGVDLVQTQLRLAAGVPIDQTEIQASPPAPRGHAIQLRVNMETLTPEGEVKPAGGVLSAFELPFGPGIRVDTQGFVGYRTSTSFDSLLAKVIGYSASPDYGDAVRRTYRALCELKIEGVATNAGFLQNLIDRPEFTANDVSTRFVDQHIAELAVSADESHRKLYPHDAATAPRHAGARVDAGDPLAVLDYGRGHGETAPATGGPAATPSTPTISGPEGTVALPAPMQGTIVSIGIEVGEPVRAGQPILVMEAMKMEHEIAASESGIVRLIPVTAGETLFEDEPLAFIEPGEVDAATDTGEAEVDLDYIRPDLAESIARHEITLDAARPDAVARRRKTGQRTARENITDLVDEDSFMEYGALTLAARRQRNSIEELIERTPADGLVCGVATVNRDIVDPDRSRCVVVSYDYTVLAGTQGTKNHQKKDRIFRMTQRRRLPLVFFCEGGGGRPGDTDTLKAANLQITTFHQFAELSGLVPLVGITSGRCFAGNAVLLGCCDVIIATRNSNIGMGGPAMIEGGGLGVFKPEEVGPMSHQVPNGVVDIAVEDEAEAVRVAKQYLSYFQGPVAEWECADQRLLRQVVPENRLRIYDIRRAIELLADTDSVLELRPEFGLGMITAFARVEGRPLGIIANNPAHLGGAIDSPAADKAARFMQICNAFDIPVLFLCDTPGNMVGPQAEMEALVRHCCRVFVIGANLTVPFFTVVTRKGYGLGAQGMAGAGFHNPLFTVSWPTGEFGGMGLEGAVKLGFRDQLAAIEDPEQRKAKYDEMVAEMYERGKAISTASFFELDDVIDPADTRRWITSAIDTPYPTHHLAGKKQPWIDAW